jgi:hypothetical protein
MKIPGATQVLIFVDANLTFFAVPKTGSTAYHVSLRGRADIVLAHKGYLKHMSARAYERHLAPWLDQAHGLRPARAAVVRDPLDHLRSWYRYRHRPERRGTPRSAADVDFDSFVLAAIADDPPRYADVGSQYAFLAGDDGAVRFEHLFAYEKLGVFHRFMEERLGRDIELSWRNVSPTVDTPISPDVEARLRAARAADFDLHARIMAAGGHLLG